MEEKSDMVVLSWTEDRKVPLNCTDVTMLFWKQKFSEKVKSILATSNTSVTLQMASTEGAQKTVDYFSGKQIEQLGKLQVFYLIFSINAR